VHDHGKRQPIVPQAKDNGRGVWGSLQPSQIAPMATEGGSDKPFYAADASRCCTLKPFWPMRNDPSG
jgi:hypothetical protein